MPDWTQPAASEWFKPGEYVGELVTFEVLSYDPAYTSPLTKPGDEGAARANITVLTGPRAGTQYLDAIENHSQLRKSLFPAVGGWVLGRIGMGGSAFILEPFTDADAAIADRYFNEGVVDTSPAEVPAAKPYTPPQTEGPTAGEVSVNPDDRVAQLERELAAARGDKPPF